MPQQWKYIVGSSEIYPLIKPGGLAECCWRAVPVALRNKRSTMSNSSCQLTEAYLKKVAPIQKEYQPRKILSESGWFASFLETSYTRKRYTPIWLLQCQALYEEKNGLMVDKHGIDFYGDNHNTFLPRYHGPTVNISLIHGGTWWTASRHTHLNDWQTGFAAALFKGGGKNRTPSHLYVTVQYFVINGSFDMDNLWQHLSRELLSDIPWNGFYGASLLFWLKAGLVYADAMHTVSPLTHKKY